MVDRQDVLRDAWLGGSIGHFSALTEARIWALREAWREFKDSDYGMTKFIAERVTVVGGSDPWSSAITEFFKKIDADLDWYPGKKAGSKPGPKSVISVQNQKTVARSAMAMKARGEEPTYPALIASNPQALLNPQTCKPVGKKRVYAIMESLCFDDPENPDDTWSHLARLSKNALTDDQIVKRLRWAEHEQEHGHGADWCYNNIVWTDICNSILARTEKRQKQLTLARKGGSGWYSPGCAWNNENLRGKKESKKQNSWDAIRIWWAPILTRGKLHVVILGEDFPGDNTEGASILVGKVKAALNIRFPNTEHPKILFVDRGSGFWATNSGRINPSFKAALQEHSLKTYYKDCAAIQPGELQEVLLHETAVSWIRYREARNRMAKPWEETEEQFGRRLRGIVQEINDKLDVDGLCRALPARVTKLVARDGGRINH